MNKPVFTGSCVAIVTPMNYDGTINYDEYGKLIEFQIENGTDAIVTCGTTGESAVMNHKEHCEVIEYTVKKVDGRIPVIAGTGSNDTAYAVELTREAKNLGADAVLSVTPYYNKTSQNGLVQHFNTIANAVDIPMILYNVPSRTGCCIKPKTYVQLAKNPNIVAVKEASDKIGDVAQTLALCGENFMLYTGCDDMTVPVMSLGGKGVISVFANVCPKEMHEIAQYCLDGDFKKGAEMHLHYLELMNALFCDVNPIPVKEAMNMMGYNCGRCRLPLVSLNEKNYEYLKSVMAKYGLLK
ncbi:MAG: 4-hydroxy-tetrahydrodipicolinate synthase [Clostridia bacterium]|nr:4-hydroxy-tetrahydrodipicolinate synthase [Clostridia bacterium]